MSRNTDPSPATVRLVRKRDRGCVICRTTYGLTTQHRKARGMGGTRDEAINDPSNLITLCGSGTTGHHGWVEHHPTASREAGWAVPSWEDPATTPVLYPDGWWLLDDVGGRAPWHLTSASGHAGSSPRGWGRTLHGEDVGRPWPPPPPRD